MYFMYVDSTDRLPLELGITIDISLIWSERIIRIEKFRCEQTSTLDYYEFGSSSIAYVQIQ